MANLFDLGGRVVVITGGNGGIGLGMAEALVRAGASVSIWGRSAEKNEAAKAQLAATGAKVETRQVDVADRAAVQSAFAETLQTFGRVDACFANAGIGGGGRRSFIERTEDEWRRMFSINLDGVFHVFQAAAKHMQERAQAGDAYGRL
ncbi:MAG TPA: SDR family NAD(P)-dependent oxidoreductase, partial [Beijerinckiaceae bacterium]|nr:SDR family NAD(P)-dependent oxidoreductase [Beijerinckiaceae bacterium]